MKLLTPLLKMHDCHVGTLRRARPPPATPSRCTITFEESQVSRHLACAPVAPLAARCGLANPQRQSAPWRRALQPLPSHRLIARRFRLTESGLRAAVQDRYSIAALNASPTHVSFRLGAVCSARRRWKDRT